MAPPPLPCYCINLEERPEKWDAIQTAFRGSDIRPVRFPGIRASPGWKGCGASHVAVARAAAEAGLPWVLVLEDDCLPAADWGERWSTIVEELWETRERWDVFLGGPTYVQGPIDRVGRGTDLWEIEQGFALHFYIIQASAYTKASAWSADRDGPIDVYYSRAFRLVTSSQLLAVQRPEVSDIKGRKTDYSDMFEESQQELDTLIYAYHTRAATVSLLLVSALVAGGLWWRRRV